MRVVEPAMLAQEITSFITAAVGAYSTSVLTRAEDAAAGATVAFGRRLIRRLAGGEADGTGTVTSAVGELAGDPQDTGLQAALRAAVAEAFRADPKLAAEIDGWQRPAAGIAISATGSRSVAAQAVNGTVITGDIRLERQ